jgi:hypothetical protein
MYCNIRGLGVHVNAIFEEHFMSEINRQYTSTADALCAEDLGKCIELNISIEILRMPFGSTSRCCNIHLV